MAVSSVSRLDPDGGEANAPPGPSAASAIDGGEGVLLRGDVAGVGQFAVVAPQVARRRGRHAVDPGELSNPQMQVHAERGAPGDDPDVAERRHQVGEEREPLVFATGRWAARRLGEKGLSEVAKVNGLFRCPDKLVHQGVRADEREQRLRIVADFLRERASLGVIQRPEQFERPVARLRPWQLRHRGVRARQVGPREAARRQPERGDPVGGAGRPLGEARAGTR